MSSRLLVDLRDEWGVQALVLFSFTLQVFLLMFASIRRHNVSIVPRFLLWLAYQLADSTALFTLGHMAISRRSLDEQPLMAFWAPFLLVHLGGQDTITAYSFEDNKLWLRHLQTLVVQVLAASYVLYKYLPEDGEGLLRVAAVLIFLVGILKYAERIWALRSASFDIIWESLDKLDAISAREDENNRLLRDVLRRRHSLFDVDDEETVLMGAHGLLDVCMGLFIGLKRGRRDLLREAMRDFTMYNRLDKLMEMELSLMYDILYTKATVIHTVYGCCTRIFSLVATVAAFILFQLSSSSSRHGGRHSLQIKDVAITYALLVGALLLELASMVRAVGSTWTCAYLYHKQGRDQGGAEGGKLPPKQDEFFSEISNNLDNHRDFAKKTSRLSPRYMPAGFTPDHKEQWQPYKEILSLRRLFPATRHRRWSGIVGQYNLLQSCADDAAAGMPVVQTTARLLGAGLGRIAQDWWDELHHSWSAKLSDSTKELVLREILRMGKRGEEIGSLPGLLTLKDFRLLSFIGWSIQDIGFEGSIMAWHLASDICLFGGRSEDQANNNNHLAEAIRVLSNYMMFLLVLRPHMLPGPVRRSHYTQFHQDLLQFMRHAPPAAAGSGSARNRLDWSLNKGFHARINSDVPHAYFDTGPRLADALYDRPDRLDVIFGVWVEMLCYVANHCSRESHARQLSLGGELVTVVWLMARHANLSFII